MQLFQSPTVSVWIINNQRSQSDNLHILFEKMDMEVVDVGENKWVGLVNAHVISFDSHSIEVEAEYFQTEL